MITVRVKEMHEAHQNLKHTKVTTFNSAANRLAQKIYKDLNNRDLKCPVCGNTSGTVIITSGQEMIFSKTGFCHPEFSDSFFFLDKVA